MKVSFWFVIIASIFVTCLITANIIAVKLIFLFGFLVPAGIIVFPLSYLFGDVLTEVYGYGAARYVIWLGFACNLLAVIAIYIGGLAPAAPFWHDQAAYNTILGFTPRLLLASFIAYLIGEFTNSFVLAKLKIATKGRWLWTRTISSTLIGEGLDTVIFISIAFWGIIPPQLILTAILTQWTFKVLYEVIATPFTYAVVGFLK
ncbi:MAG: queuosine precursor transporter, partial [Ktedonobacteraceae bacterium]